MLSDCCEDATEKRMTVMSIPVKQSILRFDKGNIKKQDTYSFKVSPIENEQKEESKSKIKFSKRGNTKRARINSESIWRRELNQMDSCVILKEMSKKHSEHNGSTSKILEEDDDSFFMNDCQNEIDNIL